MSERGDIMAVKRKPGGNENSGLKHDQKLKAYLILNHLQQETDKLHTLDACAIADKISDEYGISAERRSVYRDIDAINLAVLMAHGEASDIDEARELLEDGAETIVYDPVTKGYYYDNLFADFDDIRLAAECVYAAKFIDKNRADKIIEEIICKNISIYQKEDVLRDIFVSDRVRTTNKNLYKSIDTITEAMKHRVENDPDDPKKYKHKPEQISFKYLTHSLKSVGNEIERGKGSEYIVSPYKLMVCDGNFYLLAYNDSVKKNKVRTYRVDRMRDVKRIKNSVREGQKEVQNINLDTYTQTHFNMFEGDEEIVTIRFTNDLLDAIVDRFGDKNARYYACDNKHFTVTTKVHLSNPFYAWVFGFGNKAKIMNPPKAIDQFAKMVNTLSNMYSQDENQ